MLRPRANCINTIHSYRIYWGFGENAGWSSTPARALSMEQIRTRDDDSSPDPAPLIQVDPSLLTPNRREFDPEYPAWPSSSPSAESSDKSRFSSLQSLHLKLADLRLEPPRSKPLFRGFETPSFTRIAILTILCFITYPAACILEILASDRSLFVVRSIVAVWCSAFGISLGYVLLKIGARHIEAASEFALIGFRAFLSHYFKQPGLP